MTSLPSSTAATRACVAIVPGSRTGVTACHAPPDSARRISVPVCAHPFCAPQALVSASTCPSITSSDRIAPPGPAAAAQCSPPSVVSHSPSPNTNPWPGSANRIPHTAGPAPFCGCPSGTTGAGSPRQLAPLSSVRTIDVQGACEHGAVPRTNACSGETNVTEVAANPAGTGPPAGRVAPAPPAAGLLLAAPLARGVPVPAPVPAAGLEAAAVPPPPPPIGVVDPHPASATAVTSAPASTATRDVFIRDPSHQGNFSYAPEDATPPPPVTRSFAGPPARLPGREYGPPGSLPAPPSPGRRAPASPQATSTPSRPVSR